jgi:hypothetical protein
MVSWLPRGFHQPREYTELKFVNAASPMYMHAIATPIPAIGRHGMRTLGHWRDVSLLPNSHGADTSAAASPAAAATLNATPSDRPSFPGAAFHSPPRIGDPPTMEQPRAIAGLNSVALPPTVAPMWADYQPMFL